MSNRARQIVLTPRFRRAVKKYVGRDRNRRECIKETIARLEVNPSDPRLKTHRLTGQLAGLCACSCGYDCRIVFSIETVQSGRLEKIELWDVGTHDEVY